MLNKVTLMGRLGADPEIRNLNDGGKVANFNLATSESWKDRNGEKQERTQWHRVVVWVEGLIKVIERYVSKGDLIYIEGQLETRKWEKDGRDHYTTEVVLRPFNSTLKLLPQGGEREGGRDSRRDDRDRDRRDDRRGRDDDRRESRRSSREDFDDEIPF